MKNCKKCKHWKNNQRAVNYREDVGFCVNPKMSFNIDDGRLCGVVDLRNPIDRKEVSGNCSIDFESYGGLGQLNESRYALTTSEDFGCNLHDTK